jgi:hypothetical protein
LILDKTESRAWSLKVDASNNNRLAFANITASTIPFYIDGSAPDGSAFIDNNGKLNLSFPTNIKNYTVATLPTGARGDIAYVTDALAPTFLATIVGGGAVVTPVFYNGTNWVGF